MSPDKADGPRNVISTPSTLPRTRNPPASSVLEQKKRVDILFLRHFVHELTRNTSVTVRFRFFFFFLLSVDQYLSHG